MCRVEPGAVWDFRIAAVVKGPRWLKRDAELETEDEYGSEMPMRLVTTI